MNEMPTILTTSYTTGDYSVILDNYADQTNSSRRMTVGYATPLMSNNKFEGINALLNNLPVKKEKEKSMSKRRLVKVIVIDPDENITDLNSAVLVNDPEKFTDLNDQELFFELNMKGLLEAHNAYRVTVENKKKSTAEKTVYLEPIRIRDLKMVVVNIAEF